MDFRKFSGEIPLPIKISLIPNSTNVINLLHFFLSIALEELKQTENISFFLLGNIFLVEYIFVNLVSFLTDQWHQEFSAIKNKKLLACFLLKLEIKNNLKLFLVYPISYLVCAIVKRAEELKQKGD